MHEKYNIGAESKNHETVSNACCFYFRINVFYSPNYVLHSRADLAPEP